MGIFSQNVQNVQNVQTGAILDLRSEDEKQKDYTILELFASANPVNWVEKTPDKWRLFPVLNQKKSSSCVAHTMKKVLGVQHLINSGSYVGFSAAQVYQQRKNKPGEGMQGIDAFEIVRKNGVTLDELVPSDGLAENELNNAVIQPHHLKVAEVFKITGHVGIPARDIDSVASVIQTTGKAVMVWFYFISPEWSREVPIIETALSGPADPRSLRHSVTAVDYTLYKGQKALIIEDSAHFGKVNRRIVTEDFFKKRNWFNRYPMNFVFESGPIKDEEVKNLQYKFTKELVFLPLNDAGVIVDILKSNSQKEDVVALQNILRAEGCLPENIESTGYYGSITSKAVQAFQLKYKVASDAEINALRGRVVGPRTLAKLNELYSSN